MKELKVSGVHNGKDFAPGWLGDYVDLCGKNRVPQSYHVLSALCALGTVVGRTAAVHRSSFVLYPPQSILLLGNSGVGKSQALRLMKSVIQKAVRPMSGFPSRPAYYLGSGTLTPRGLMQDWLEMQALDQTEILEGIHIEGEIANLITARKGTENLTPWMIQVLEHDVVEDRTGTYGIVRIGGVTVSFALGSTLEYLRKSISADEFAGGFMHRFLLAYEEEQDYGKTEIKPAEADIENLALDLRKIHANAPKTLGISSGAEKRLELLHNRQTYYSNHYLSGYWNRYDGLVLKVAQLFTLATGGTTVSKEHVVLADRLFSEHLYEPLAGVIDQVSSSKEHKHLLAVSDSLKSAGPKGWTTEVLLNKLGLGGSHRALDALTHMEETGMIFRKGTGRWVGRSAWISGEV